MNEKQPFIPDEWILSYVDQDDSPYDGSAIYVSPNNKCYKAPLTESALQIIQKYPNLMDYREMTHMIVDEWWYKSFSGHPPDPHPTLFFHNY